MLKLVQVRTVALERLVTVERAAPGGFVLRLVHIWVNHVARQ